MENKTKILRKKIKFFFMVIIAILVTEYTVSGI